MFLQKEGNFIVFTPDDQLVPGKYGSTLSLECYYCHEWGHISNNCPQISSNRVRSRGGRRGGGSRTGVRYSTGLLHIRIGFAQNTDGMIPNSWILLDTCSTSSVCNNKEMIGNIRDFTSDETLTVYKNGGSKTFTKMEPFTFYL